GNCPGGIYGVDVVVGGTVGNLLVIRAQRGQSSRRIGQIERGIGIADGEIDRRDSGNAGSQCNWDRCSYVTIRGSGWEAHESAARESDVRIWSRQAGRR